MVAPFVAGYEAGETPNPCVRCNGSFRFGELLAFARRVGAARLATGHYARLREHRGRLLLARAADPAKDQSYMLARLDPRRLPHLWFPLGEWTKEETRARARSAGLAAGDAMTGSSKRNASISQAMSTSSGSRVRRLGTMAMSSKP